MPVILQDAPPLASDLTKEITGQLLPTETPLGHVPVVSGAHVHPQESSQGCLFGSLIGFSDYEFGLLVKDPGWLIALEANCGSNRRYSAP